MNASPNKVDVGRPSKSGTTQRNRFVVWERASQDPNNSGVGIPSPKKSTSLRPLNHISSITKSIVKALLSVLYTFIKVGYEVAKFATRGLSSIRRFLFVTK